jgi:molybdopterin-dependent oxidoreductase alpha subunit
MGKGARPIGEPEDAQDAQGAHAQPPLERARLRQRSVATAAGGLPAVTSALAHVVGEVGLLRGAKLLLRVNQNAGFDCPGCAWPEPDRQRSIVEFCENGAKAIAEEGTRERIGPAFFAEYSVAELSRQSDFWLGKQGRLTHPMWLEAGASHYQPISWDRAFELIATQLSALSSPDEALFYTSGRTSNEAAFLYQLFVREYGTNNLPDCSNMCHESSGSGLTETIGIGKGTVKLEDVERAQLIFVIGQNPGTNHPRMLSALQTAKRAGARIVSINPLPEAGLVAFIHPQEPWAMFGSGTALTDLFLQVRINGDVPLLQGIAKAILEEERRAPGSAVDRGFVEQRTEGYRDFCDNLARVQWPDLERGSGIARAQMERAARLLIDHERIVFCWAMGLTQHENAVDNVREIVNLLLLRGAIGRPGAGVCPVRGHSNVQGDRTMGIYEKPSATFLDALDHATGIKSPRRHGFDTVEAIAALAERRAKVFVAMGGNFLSATPDTEFTAAALRMADLTAHISTKLNRAHLVTGKQALILPCLGRTERDVQATGPQFVTTENSMGVVQMSRGTAAPASELLLSEPQIVARLAQATLGSRSRVAWRELAEDYDRIRELIEKVIAGFDGYNARVRQPGGFYLPNPARDGRFATESGRARFTVHALPEHRLGPGQLLMMTVRTHDQYNTTIYGMEDRYRGLSMARRVLLMNAEDMRERGLQPHQAIDVTSHFRGETRIAKRFVAVPYDIPRGCTCSYFPEANVLVPLKQVARISNTPASKSVVITVEASRDAPDSSALPEDAIETVPPNSAGDVRVAAARVAAPRRAIAALWLGLAVFVWLLWVVLRGCA